MRSAFLLSIAIAAPLAAQQWSAPVEVLHQEDLVMTYQARLEGDYLLVRANLEPGWHTFSMDNKVRAIEKLAGKQALGIDRPTTIAVTGGAQVAGPWMQSEPKDFSKPALRIFSWGFEGQALFAAKVKRIGKEPAQLEIRGQACTDSVCKNLDVTFSVPGGAASASAAAELKSLTPVRQ